MKRHLLLGIAGLWGLLIGGAFAQQPQGPVVVEIRVKTIIGKVMLLDAKAGKLTIRVKDLAENIVVSADCKFGDELDGLASLNELRIGEEVVATCVDENGSLQARRIARLKPKKARATPRPSR